jgi:hypothetical protein
VHGALDDDEILVRSLRKSLAGLAVLLKYRGIDPPQRIDRVARIGIGEDDAVHAWKPGKIIAAFAELVGALAVG